MDSFNSIKKWLVDVERFASPNVLKLIVGNKNDLSHRRAVDFKVAKVLLSHSHILVLG
jgi:Ras-related protein Rab-1A